VVNSGAKRGLPCEILTISQGRERAEEGVFWRGAPLARKFLHDKSMHVP
jgi:hypothetical protein